jgi:hypothetical protein
MDTVERPAPSETEARRAYVIFSEIMEHVVGTSSGLRRRKKLTLWRGRPLRNGRKSSIKVRRAGCGGAPATPGVIVPTGEEVTVRLRERESEKGRNDCG